MTAKKTYFVGKNFPRTAKRNDLAINTEDGTVNYRGPNGWVSVGGSGGSGGSLTVPTSIKDSNGSDLITFTRTGTGTARIGTPQDDLSLRSARDITLYAGDDGPGNVYIGWGDAVYTPDSPNRVATIGDIQAGSTGDITFEGIQIRGAGTGSGDGYNNGTIELVPDADLYDNGQRLIIDPTGPNHIHIRAGEHIYGGSSNPELYLGDDKTNVGVVTWNGDVNINTQNRPRILVQNTNTGSGSTLNYDSNSYNYDWEVYDTLLLEDGAEFQVTGYGEGSVTVEGFTFTPNNYYYFADNLNTYKWHFRNNGMFELQNSNGMDLGIKVSQIKFGSTDAYNSSKIGTDGYQIALYSEDGIKINNENGVEYLKFNLLETPGLLYNTTEISTPYKFLTIDGYGGLKLNSTGTSVSKIVLSASQGSYIDDETNPNNQIATIGNLAYIRASVPTSSIGVEGDVEGMVADDGNFHYYCTGDYDGTNHVWKRVGWTAGTWGV
jgi:hypothetical protein